MARALSSPGKARAGRGIPAPRREWPSVGVVVVTRNRPHLVRRALASVSKQDYPGPLRTVVVYDGVPPDWRLAHGGERPLLVLENWRTPGQGGARNTGILAAGDCELVAFCDDDDTWAPEKLTIQVAAMRARPGTHFATCGVEVEYDGRRRPRLAGRAEIRAQHLTRRRPRRLRPSGFVARQDILATDPERGGIGLLAEDGPAGGVAWDLLLRAAALGPILNLDRPLVRMLRRRVDLDAAGCRQQARALRWLLAQHPQLRRQRAAAARIYAEMASWEAAGGDLARARVWTRAALRHRWYEPRIALALAAAAGILRGRRLRGLLGTLLGA